LDGLAPWTALRLSRLRRLAIFYKDSGYASGLVHLEHIESGMEKLTTERGNFTVKAEKID
jgi:hypothetical protein